MQVKYLHLMKKNMQAPESTCYCPLHSLNFGFGEAETFCTMWVKYCE